MWNMYRNLTVFKSLINTPKQVLPPKHSQFAKAKKKNKKKKLKTVFKKQAVPFSESISVWAKGERL